MQPVGVIQVLAAVEQIDELADVVVALYGHRQAIAADRRRRKRHGKQLGDFRQPGELARWQGNPPGYAGCGCH